MYPDCKLTNENLQTTHCENGGMRLWEPGSALQFFSLLCTEFILGF